MTIRDYWDEAKKAFLISQEGSFAQLQLQNYPISLFSRAI